MSVIPKFQNRVCFMTTRIRRFSFIPNTSEGILDYLVQRSSCTIGKQVDQSHLIIIGTVEEVAHHSVVVRHDEMAALEPWLSSEAGTSPELTFQVTRVLVKQLLIGFQPSERIEINYPNESRSGRAGSFPIFVVGDRGLLFLIEVPADAPYAAYVSQPAYQLALGEKGVRNFLVADYDEQGQPFTRDQTVRVEETISAIKWYASLPRENPQALREALIEALDHTNSQIVRHAIRALALRKDSSVLPIFEGRIKKAPADLKLRLMLGLWILGKKDSAKAVLDEFFEQEGKYNWLAGWDVKLTEVEPGQKVDVLNAPDPSEVKGD